MPIFVVSGSKMEDEESDVTVVDVYDIASEIGKEFERIIDTNGVDLVSKVLPKVISALEHLENFASKNEKENNVLQELTAKITRLEMEKIEKAEDRQRFEAVSLSEMARCLVTCIYLLCGYIFCRAWACIGL